MTETTEITTAQLADWLWMQTWSDFAQSLAAYYTKKGTLTEKQEAAARKMYTKVEAKKVAKATATPKGKVTEDGIYKLADGTIYKLQFAHHGSGNLYGKRLVIHGDHGEFVYEAGVPFKVTAADKLSLEEAVQFGKLYGFCVRCGATLTDEKSIEAGIGPVCATKF